MPLSSSSERSSKCPRLHPAACNYYALRFTRYTSGRGSSVSLSRHRGALYCGTHTHGTQGALPLLVLPPLFGRTFSNTYATRTCIAIYGFILQPPQIACACSSLLLSLADRPTHSARPPQQQHQPLAHVLTRHPAGWLKLARAAHLTSKPTRPERWRCSRSARAG